eukprot:Rhum_TRINITY_DN11697_c1_g2::Rhum_TRINITY_DN11697_c1_g2_i1::g.46152::m.46152
MSGNGTATVAYATTTLVVVVPPDDDEDSRLLVGFLLALIVICAAAAVAVLYYSKRAAQQPRPTNASSLNATLVEKEAGPRRDEREDEWPMTVTCSVARSVPLQQAWGWDEEWDPAWGDQAAYYYGPAWQPQPATAADI